MEKAAEQFIELHGSKTVMGQPIQLETPEYIDIPFVEEIEEILLAPLVSEEDYNELTQGNTAQYRLRRFAVILHQYSVANI